MQISDAASGTVLDTETVSSFGGGTYLQWKVSGDVAIKVSAVAGANAVLTGLFFDPSATATATATFLKQDATTSGTWVGTYGHDGTDIQGYSAGLPSYAGVSFSANASPYTWSTGTTDTRAPQNPGNPTGSRVAAAWYNTSGSSFTITVNLTDGQAHDLALYFLDWPKTGRKESVQISDAASGAVLDTEAVSSFGGGTYLQWKVSGNVVIKVSAVSGANAVLTGLFFDSATAGSARVADPGSAEPDAIFAPPAIVGGAAAGLSSDGVEANSTVLAAGPGPSPSEAAGSAPPAAGTIGISGADEPGCGPARRGGPSAGWHPAAGRGPSLGAPTDRYGPRNGGSRAGSRAIDQSSFHLVIFNHGWSPAPAMRVPHRLFPLTHECGASQMPA